MHFCNSFFYRLNQQLFSFSSTCFLLDWFTSFVLFSLFLESTISSLLLRFYLSLLVSILSFFTLWLLLTSYLFILSPSFYVCLIVCLSISFRSLVRLRCLGGRAARNELVFLSFKKTKKLKWKSRCSRRFDAHLKCACVLFTIRSFVLY